MNTRKVGTQKEALAGEFLEHQGVCILERNFRTKTGEIDLIGVCGHTLIFFEVKYRKTEKYGFPAEAVDKRKQLTICRVSDQYRYIKREKLHGIFHIRYDVIVILGDRITWLKNAFMYQGNGWY